MQKNIEITKQVVEYAKNNNVTVEAEIGKIGGSEDGKNSDLLYNIFLLHKKRQAFI